MGKSAPATFDEPVQHHQLHRRGALSSTSLLLEDAFSQTLQSFTACEHPSKLRTETRRSQTELQTLSASGQAARLIHRHADVSRTQIPCQRTNTSTPLSQVEDGFTNRRCSQNCKFLGSQLHAGKARLAIVRSKGMYLSRKDSSGCTNSDTPGRNIAPRSKTYSL